MPADEQRNDGETDEQPGEPGAGDTLAVDEANRHQRQRTERHPEADERDRLQLAVADLDEHERRSPERAQRDQHRQVPPAHEASLRTPTWRPWRLRRRGRLNPVGNGARSEVELAIRITHDAAPERPVRRLDSLP